MNNNAPTEIYLLTVKDPYGKKQLKKKAYTNFQTALDKYREIFTSLTKSGYVGTDNTQTDETLYVKSAKLTTKNDTTVRLRLENVELI